MNYSCLQKTSEGVVISLQVLPRSSRNQLVGLQGGLLRVKLTSPPVEGAANKCCREYFAKLLHVSKGQVELLSGERSRKKRLLFRGVTLLQASAMLQENLVDPS